MAEVYQLPENGNNSVPAWLPYVNGQGNGFLGGNGWGGGILGFLLGLMFGNGGFGNFGGGFGGNNGAGFLANQINNDNGRELLMNAITSQGEASRAATQNLATMLGQDYNTVNTALQTIQGSLATIAAQQGMSTLQVVNAIQNGNCQLGQQLQQCCCENRLLTTQQGYEAQIRTLEQTNQLGAQADRNNNAVISAINAQTVAMNDQFCALKERELQAKIDAQADTITQLRGQIDNANQTSQILAYVNNAITPLQNKVNDIAAKQLPTVPVQYPQLTAVNTGAYTGGGAFYGNGFGGGIIF